MRLPQRLPRIICLTLGVLGTAVLGDTFLRAEQPQPRATLEGHKGSIWSLDFSPDSATLASSGCDHTVRLWDIAKGKERACLRGHTAEVYCVSFSPNGKILASGSKDQTVKLWDVATGRERATLKGHQGSVCALAFTPDGRTLASGSGDCCIKLWDVVAGRERATLWRHWKMVSFLAFSPDGQTLASVSKDESLRLWNLPSGKQIATSLVGLVQSVAFSPDGKSLALALNGTTTKLWEVATCKQRAVLQGDQQAVLTLGFSRDSKRLVSGHRDRAITVWDLATGTQGKTFSGYDDTVSSLSLSPDEKTLASACLDGTVKLWDLTVTTEAGTKTQTNHLSSARLKETWATLVGDDAARAYGAIQSLSSSNETAQFLGERLRPAPNPNARQVTLLIADLDSRRFAVRQKATKELEEAGGAVEGPLRKKLAEKPPLEVRRRIEDLLAKLNQPLSGDTLRTLRSVEVLEHMGSPEAMKVLEKLATGAEGALLTREAKASLERLKKRTSSQGSVRQGE